MIIVQRQLGGLYYRTNVRTMASPATSRLAASLRPLSPPGKSRFDRRLAKILTHAINVFYEKGYEGPLPSGRSHLPASHDLTAGWRRF